jgi:hypothetical protein
MNVYRSIIDTKNDPVLSPAERFGRVAESQNKKNKIRQRGSSMSAHNCMDRHMSRSFPVSVLK